MWGLNLWYNFSMSDKDKQIVIELRKRLGVDLLSHVRSIILFGSRARGDASPDSDLDLAVLVDKKKPELEKALEETAYQIMWDHDFSPVVSLKVFQKDRFDLALQKGFSFYRNVMGEGIQV